MVIHYLCEGCLSNDSLKQFVKHHSVKRLKECPICQSKNKLAMDLSTLAEHLASCISHNYSSLESRDGTDYDPDRDCFYYIDTNKPVEITNICEILEEHNVLNSNIEYETRVDIYKAIFESVNPKKDIYAHLAEKGWVHYVSDELFFKWETFNYLIQNNNRFFDYDQQYRSECLEKILSALDVFEDEIAEGTEFCRLRNDNNLQVDIMDNPDSALKEISPAPCKFTQSYRMSPKGISYTYLSSDIKTCMEECNTQDGDRVLIGIFKAIKPLKILDLQIKENPYIDLFSGHYDRTKENIGRFIMAYTSEISKPVDSNSEFDYLATQVIAEYIRFKGYDGIAYSSAKTGETNFVFFYGPDYYKYPDIRPQGWNPYVASVPKFTKAFALKGCALFDVINSDSGEINELKRILDFEFESCDL